MGVFSQFEERAERIIEGGGASTSLSVSKLAKRAVKEMQREKMVGVGHEYAPTLFNVLVSEDDDMALEKVYPDLAAELEICIEQAAKRAELELDCPPLVRFMVDESLRHNKFYVVAENVSPAIIEELRQEEMEHYGIAPKDEPFDDYNNQQEEVEFDPFLPSDEQGISTPPMHHPDSEPMEAIPAADPFEVPAEVAAAAAGAAAAGAVAAGVAAMPDDEEPEEELEEETAIPAADETVMLGHASAASSCATLIDRKTGVMHKLIDNVITIGRNNACMVRVDDLGVSRFHAELQRDSRGWILRDTDSLNGTAVNGTPIETTYIRNGDIISLGNAQFEFREG